MHILFGFFTVVLIFDCMLLIFLVLLQLPKKEAGAGMAFGGAATDALFGAGSGNALTTITKWTAGIFFGLSLILAMMTSHLEKNGGGALENALTQGKSPTFSQPGSNEPSSTPNIVAGSNETSLGASNNPLQLTTPAPSPLSNTATPPVAPQTPAPATNK